MEGETGTTFASPELPETSYGGPYAPTPYPTAYAPETSGLFTAFPSAPADSALYHQPRLDYAAPSRSLSCFHYYSFFLHLDHSDESDIILVLHLRLLF